MVHKLKICAVCMLGKDVAMATSLLSMHATCGTRSVAIHVSLRYASAALSRQLEGDGGPVAEALRMILIWARGARGTTLELARTSSRSVIHRSFFHPLG